MVAGQSAVGALASAKIDDGQPLDNGSIKHATDHTSSSAVAKVKKKDKVLVLLRVVALVWVLFYAVGVFRLYDSATSATNVHFEENALSPFQAGTSFNKTDLSFAEDFTEAFHNRYPSTPLERIVQRSQPRPTSATLEYDAAMWLAKMLIRLGLRPGDVVIEKYCPWSGGDLFADRNSRNVGGDGGGKSDGDVREGVVMRGARLKCGDNDQSASYNVHGVWRPARAQGTDGLVVVSQYDPRYSSLVDDGGSHDWVSDVGLSLAILRHIQSVEWLSKDAIFLFTSAQSPHDGVRNWLHSYHNSPIATAGTCEWHSHVHNCTRWSFVQASRHGEMDSTRRAPPCRTLSKTASVSESNIVRPIAPGVRKHWGTPSEPGMCAPSYEPCSLQLTFASTYPVSQDFLNCLVYIAMRDGDGETISGGGTFMAKGRRVESCTTRPIFTPRSPEMAKRHQKEGCQTVGDRIQAYDHVLNRWGLSWLTTPTLDHEREEVHLPPVTQKLATVAEFLFRHSFQTPSGVHALFNRYNIDAVTLSAVLPPLPADGSTTAPSLPLGFHSFGSLARIVEGGIRVISNLEQHLHQSFYFFYQPSAKTFVASGEYFITIAFLLGPMPVHGVLEAVRLPLSTIGVYFGTHLLACQSLGLLLFSLPIILPVIPGAEELLHSAYGIVFPLGLHSSIDGRQHHQDLSVVMILSLVVLVVVTVAVVFGGFARARRWISMFFSFDQQPASTEVPSASSPLDKGASETEEAMTATAAQSQLDIITSRVTGGATILVLFLCTMSIRNYAFVMLVCLFVSPMKLFLVPSPPRLRTRNIIKLFISLMLSPLVLLFVASLAFATPVTTLMVDSLYQFQVFGGLSYPFLWLVYTPYHLSQLSQLWDAAVHLRIE